MDAKVAQADQEAQARPRVTIVLGMHRSGSSALARGMKALGMELGEQLIPANPWQHPSGLWEHKGVVDLNDSILASAGLTWHSPARLGWEFWEKPALAQFFERARQLVAREFPSTAHWSVCDPRMCRLLGFWRPVLEQSGIALDYIISVRDPVSVCASLLSHDGFDLAKSQILYLDHYLAALLDSAGSPRVAVAYGRLIADPRAELSRVARALGTPVPDDRAIQLLAQEFRDFELSPRPRDQDGRQEHHELFPLIRRLHELLDRAAADHRLLSDRAWQAALSEVSAGYEQLRPLYAAYDQAREKLKEHVKVLRTERTRWESDLRDLQSLVKAQVHQLEVQQTTLDAVFGSRSWRVTAPLRTLAAMLRRLRRRAFVLAAEPFENVRPDGQGRWTATSTRPLFSLFRQGKEARFPSGMARVQISLTVDQSDMWPRLWCDEGQGFSNTSSSVLPSPRDGWVRGVIWLPANVRGMRLAPVGEPVSFALGTIRFTEITRLEGALRVFWGELVPRLIDRYGWRGALLRTWYIARTEGIGVPAKRLWDGYRRIIGLRKLGQSRYADWAENHVRLTPADREAIVRHVERLPRKPLLSVLMPVYNTPLAWLRRALDSARAQLYPYWELCIADDCSSDPEVWKVLEEYAAQDSRIKVVRRTENGHISRASNSALELATGEFVALFDHDDELMEQALYMVAVEINAHSDADLIYSDEAKVDAKTYPYDPYFKPDWNPELFYGHNLITHLGVYRTELVRRLGGFRPGFEGSQDYDLALRIIECTQAEKIRHIPYVLYHWRAHPASTAKTMESKPYALEAARRAIQEHFSRRGMSVTVTEGLRPFLHRVIYPLSEPLPMVSLLVPTRDRSHLLRQCVEGLLGGTDYPALEVIILDNGSREESALNYLRAIGRNAKVRVIRHDAPFNFAELNNLGAREARGELIGLINNDIKVIHPDWLQEMVRHAIRPEVGAVGAKLYYGDGRIQHAGIILGIGTVAGHPYRFFSRDTPGHQARALLTQNLSAVTGACLLTRRSVYEEAGGLDETLAVAYNDVDYCLRVRERGYRIVWTPHAELYHLESASRGYEDSAEKLVRFTAERAIMTKRWGDQLRTDPFYSPNLTLEFEDVSYADPPRVKHPWHEAEETHDSY